MARFAFRRFGARRFTTLMLALLLPSVASAEWGTENWGEMVWGGAASPIPSMPIEGLIALAMLLLLGAGVLLARRRRTGRA